MLLCTSCKVNYKLLNKDKTIQRIDISSTYKLYQFTMYRDKAFIKDKLINPEFTAEEKANSTVHEILYILRDTLSNKVIYVTTDSHKYLYRNQGELNAPMYKENMIFNDLDYLYLGKESVTVKESMGIKDSIHKFSFYNPEGRSYAHNLHMYFTEDEHGIKIDSVTNDYAIEDDRIENPYIVINRDVFGIDIRFTPQGKAYSYNIIENKKRTGKLDKVKAILVQGTNVFLELNTYSNANGNPFFRNRIKYVEPY